MSEMVERFWSKVRKSADHDCWEWTAHRAERGYGTMRFNGKMQRAHRIAYQISKGPIPEGLMVRHTCDNPPCCNPRHLEVGTCKDNVRDRIERGRSADVRGSKHPNSKFTEDQVVDIRRRLANGERRADLAREFGVSGYGIYHLRKGWKHIDAALGGEGV